MSQTGDCPAGGGTAGFAVGVGSPDVAVGGEPGGADGSHDAACADDRSVGGLPPQRVGKEG
eukprot:212684-Alexandrium_andersonii.AAC.1